MLATQLLVLGMLVPSVMLAVAARLRGKQGKRVGRRSFIIRHLLRGPGESLRIRLEQLNVDIAACIALALITPAVACMLLVPALAHNEAAAVAGGAEMLIAAPATLCLAYVLRALLSLVAERRCVAMEHEASIAVSQELNALMCAGYRVFHDVPAGEFSVGHAVVGASGVYALETKAFMAPHARRDWNVVYDGACLKFPGHVETESIGQAIRSAAWLQDWLSEALGRNVPVHPVLVLPGWYVNRTGGSGIRIGNGKNMEALLSVPESGCRPLSAKLRQQIAHQFDLRCRGITEQTERDLEELEHALNAEPAAQAA